MESDPDLFHKDKGELLLHLPYKVSKWKQAFKYKMLVI